MLFETESSIFSIPLEEFLQDYAATFLLLTYLHDDTRRWENEISEFSKKVSRSPGVSQYFFGRIRTIKGRYLLWNLSTLPIMM